MGVTLFKVGDFYHYRFQVDGKRVKKTTREKTLAKARPIAEDAYDAAKLRARGLEPEPKLGDLVSQWIEAHEHVLSESRLQTMEVFGRLHIATLKGLQLRECTTALVEAARSEYLKGHARESANTWLGCLGALFRWAMRRRMIRDMPWHVKALKVKRRSKPLLPTAKAGEWMAAMERLCTKEPGILLVVRLMIGLGLRISEGLGARWEWLDLERETYTPGDTKGGEAWPRPVSPWLLGILKPLAQVSGPIVHQVVGKKITESRVAYLMAQANRACGLLHITPHRLRATYATWLSELGVPIQDIARALGHKDIRTTLRYLEVGLGRVAAAQILIGKRLGMDGQKEAPPPHEEPIETQTPGF